MSKPALLVIAGCNGSGKSSFSGSLAPAGFTPFDYDLCFLRFYKSLFDSDIQETMAHNMAFEELQRQIGNALAHSVNFCYETNFDSTPLHWPMIFKQRDYKLHMIYLCLNSVEEAKRRVNIRVENGGHFVSEEEIKHRYFAGFSNLNQYFDVFDEVDVFDTSANLKEPKHVISLERGIVLEVSRFPIYLRHLLPRIASMVTG